MQNTKWEQASLEEYINNEVEENIHLDYKAAGSLAKTDDKRFEITKDVSAMANSDGGLIIYGVKEFQDKKYLPEKLDPIDRTEFSKEWLEQVINNIRPPIPGLIIHPVSLASSPNYVAYVVEIPRSITAHQATDFRYYMRYNFTIMYMYDHQVKDVINRINYSDVIITFELSRSIKPQHGEDVEDKDDILYSRIHVKVKNVGNRLVNHYKVELEYDNVIWTDENGNSEIIPIVELPSLWDNTRAKLVSGKIGLSGSLYTIYHSDTILFPQEEIDIGEMVGLSYTSTDIWSENFQWKNEAKKYNWTIEWKLYADSMPCNEGKVSVWDLSYLKPSQFTGQQDNST